MGKALYVTRENAVKLQKDEYFIADMIGMRCGFRRKEKNWEH